MLAAPAASMTIPQIDAAAGRVAERLLREKPEGTVFAARFDPAGNELAAAFREALVKRLTQAGMTLWAYPESADLLLGGGVDPNTRPPYAYAKLVKGGKTVAKAGSVVAADPDSGDFKAAAAGSDFLTKLPPIWAGAAATYRPGRDLGFHLDLAARRGAFEAAVERGGYSRGKDNREMELDYWRAKGSWVGKSLRAGLGVSFDQLTSAAGPVKAETTHVDPFCEVGAFYRKGRWEGRAALEWVYERDSQNLGPANLSYGGWAVRLGLAYRLAGP